MTKEEIIDGLEILLFLNDRIGRELWNGGSKKIQDKAIAKAEEILQSAISELKKDLSRIYTDNDVVEELEKIKGEIKEYGSIWVQYSIKGHTDKDIDDIVDDVLKQAKQSFIRRLDKHISELKGENK